MTCPNICRILLMVKFPAPRGEFQDQIPPSPLSPSGESRMGGGGVVGHTIDRHIMSFPVSITNSDRTSSSLSMYG